MVHLVQSTRDRGLTALFEGFFGAAWFGWAQATAPARLGGWLTAGGSVCRLWAGGRRRGPSGPGWGAPAGGGGPGRARPPPPARPAGAPPRRYGIVVGVE